METQSAATPLAEPFDRSDAWLRLGGWLQQMLAYPDLSSDFFHLAFSTLMTAEDGWRTERKEGSAV